MNLVTNALKFTIEGSITIVFNFNSHLSLLVIKVKDTGIGIKYSERDKLFTLFGKLESSPTLNAKGIGLGLNICKKIVEACGGNIYLD